MSGHTPGTCGHGEGYEAVSAHTPERWGARAWSRHSPTTIVREVGDGFEVIAEVEGFGSDPKTIARARLIAAAPDLLEALTMVRDADEDCARDGLNRIPPAARATIDAAIAKATGAA